MTTVSSINYDAKRIYLHLDTVDTDLDTMDIYREVRVLRRTNENHRKYDPIIVAGGNIAKIAGVFYTPSYVQLLNGCRIVPYDGVDHTIRLIRDTFTDDGYSGVDCFDRSGIYYNVNIDIDFPEIEIVVIQGGSGLSTEQNTQLMKTLTIAKYLGLK